MNSSIEIVKYDIKETLINAIGIVSDPRKSFDAAAKLTEWVLKRFNQRFLKYEKLLLCFLENAIEYALKQCYEKMYLDSLSTSVKALKSYNKKFPQSMIGNRAENALRDIFILQYIILQEFFQ